MVRFIFFFVFILSISFAKKPENMNLIELFKNKYYSYICMHRWIYINKYEKKNEKLLSIVAYSCLKKHYLTPAIDLSKVLRMTKLGRINATYINALFMVKLLLIRFIEDNYDISEVKLPQIENSLLAKVFILTQKQKPIVENHSFRVSDGKSLYVITFKPIINNIIIDIFQNDKLIKRVKYW